MGGLQAKKKKKKEEEEQRSRRQGLEFIFQLSASQSLRVKNAEVMVLLCQVYHRKIPAGDKWRKHRVSFHVALITNPPKSMEDGTCYVPKHNLPRIFLQAVTRQCEGPSLEELPSRHEIQATCQPVARTKLTDPRTRHLHRRVHTLTGRGECGNIPWHLH